MAHMSCECKNDLWNGDGEIVYEVYKVKDLKKCIEGNNSDKTFYDLYNEEAPIYDDNPYFWYCNKCKRIHLWSYKPKYCYRKYKLRNKIEENIDIKAISNLDEYIVVNFNEIEQLNNYRVKSAIEKNPLRPYKYYVTNDLTKIYILNTDSKLVEKIYDLTYESYVKYTVNLKNVDNLLIYTINKKNKGHEYIVKNGVRTQKDIDDYPHKQVNFMTHDKNSKLYYADPNKKTETYTKDTMNEFNKKYGKYFEKKK